MNRLKKEEKRDAKTKWDERHWSDKPLDDMSERDWRIFKEDYNIQTKGGKVANPLRNWKEADLPKEVMDVINKIGYTVRREGSVLVFVMLFKDALINMMGRRRRYVGVL